MEVRVRRAQPDDYEVAGAATAAAYKPFLDLQEPSQREYLQTIANVATRAETGVVFVAEVDGTVAGSVTLVFDLDYAVEPGASHVRMLGVAPGYEGLGAGRALLAACIDHTRQVDARIIGLRTMPPMHRAQRLYENAGFRRYPEQDYDDEKWGSFLAYRRDL